MTSRTAAAERLDWAVRRLMECRSTTAVVTLLADEWGVSRRSAQRIVARAHQQLVADLDETERTHLTAQLCHGLMEAMAQALKSGNSGAVVGAARELRSLVGLGPGNAPTRSTFSTYSNGKWN
jgi:hypothetical protein